MPEGILDRDEGSRDTRLIERAIRERWPIPDNIRQALINRQASIAINPQSKPAEATRAFLAILAAEQQNQADQKLLAPKKKKKPQQVIHTHILEQPVTEENLEERRRLNLERLAAGRQNAAGDG